LQHSPVIYNYIFINSTSICNNYRYYLLIKAINI